MADADPLPRSKAPRRLRRALLALSASAVLALIAAELGLRFLLFHPALASTSLAKSFRRPERFADGNANDDYWKLMFLFEGDRAIAEGGHHDPITGWTGSLVEPGTYAHVDEGDLRGRRPILLYGDSFAACLTPAEECFQGLLERSELGRDHALLNYGVGGYGVDQIHLLIEGSIDRFAALDPIVVVSLLVDGDFDRSVLSFRGLPKPRLDVAGDRLVPRGPVEPNARVFLAQHPVEIRSYLWRLFLFSRSRFLRGPRTRWRADPVLEQEKKELNRRILIEIERSLSRRGLRHFYLAFHTEPGAIATWAPFAWHERMLEEHCAEYGAQLSDTRPFFVFAAEGRAENAAAFYGRGSPLQGHHNAMGNLVCFEALLQGVRDQRGPPDFAHLRELKEQGLLDWRKPERSAMVALGREATLVTYASGGTQRATETAEPPRLLLRAGKLGPTSLQFELEGRAVRLRGQVSTVADDCGSVELRFRVALDDRVALDLAVPPSESPAKIDVDLTGARRLELAVQGDRGRGSCNWVALGEPRIE